MSSSKFLLVDDDPISNRIAKILMKRKFDAAEIIAFEKPLEALDYIKKNHIGKEGVKTILLLDINMPLINGWEFLLELKKLGDEIVSQFEIYMLSSSVDDRDIEKTSQNPDIIGFISKPLKEESLIQFES